MKHLSLRHINPSDLLFKIAFILFVIGCAFVFGLLSASGNPMMIGLAVGVVVGTLLLKSPSTSVSILIVVGLMMGALISFAGSAFGKLPWAMSLLGMMLLLPALLSRFRAKNNPVPTFIGLAAAFLVYAVAATVFQWNPLPESIAGFKRYFQVFGLLFAMALLPFTQRDFQRWQKILLGIALLQFPFALYALLVLVPQRGGLSKGSATTDVVAGTFGANLEGGSPGIVMVVFLLIVFVFLFSRWRLGLITTSKLIALAFLLLLPIGMGENKVAILMVPMVWFVLVRHDIVRNPVKYFPTLIAGVLVTVIFGYVMVVFIMHSNIEDVLQSTISYNFANAGYATFYLNRTTVLTFWLAEQGLHDPVGFFFGHGLGSAFLGEISGHIGMRYPRYGIDLTAASTLLWDLGLVGLSLFLGIFVSAWRAVEKVYRETNDAVVRADCLAVQAAISLFLTLVIYSQDIVNLISMEIVYSVVLGYAGYICSQHMAVARTTRL